MKERYQIKVAVFLVITRENENGTEILLQRRRNTGYMDGKYDMACSGHLEKDESMAHAVAREAKEELGIEIDEHNLELVHLLHPYKEEYINAFFKAQKYTGTPVIIESEKCDDLSWFNINNLPENIIPKHKHVIECIKNNILYSDGNKLGDKYEIYGNNTMSTKKR